MKDLSQLVDTTPGRAAAANSAPPVNNGTQGTNRTDVAPVPGSPEAGKKSIGLIIQPSARDRWQSALLATYTPAYVENIIRGAMAGNLLSQWLMFDLMERTWPRLTKNLNELKDAVNDLEWNLQPFALSGQKPTKEALRRKRIIEYIIWNMSPDVKKNENNFEGTVYDTMDALGKAIAVLEMDIPAEPARADLGEGMESFFPLRATRWVHPRYYGYPNSPVTSDELMLNWKEVKFSNPDALIPPTEDDGTRGTRPSEYGGEQWVPFPEDKFIVSVMKLKSGHPINAGMLTLLGFFWSATNFVWEWHLNYAQIFGQPIRTAEYDPNASYETISAVENFLQTMGSNAWAAFPAGTKFQILEAMKGGGQNPQKVFIDAADTICDLVVLNEAMSSEHGGAGGRGGGTQASATVGKGKRDEKVHATAGRVATILNDQMIKPLCRLNFGDDQQCPYLEASAKQSKDSVAVATKYKTILSIPKVRVSQEQFYLDNDLVQPGPGDAVFEGAAAGASTGQAGGGDGGGDGDLEEGEVTGSAGAPRPPKGGTPNGVMHAHAHAADAQLVDAALADATGIAPRWLGAVRPIFSELIRKAKDGSVSDSDFINAVARAQKQLPDVFNGMDHEALARVIEGTMASAVVNGAVRGARRRPGTKESQEVLA